MRIVSLKPSQRVKGRYLLHMEDGSILRIGERELLNFSCYTDKNLSEEEIEALKQSVHAGGLKDKALAALTRKPMSRRELERKLQQWEASEEESTAICDRMEELKFLDDARYAETVVRHYSAKGYGAQKLRAELSHRGVPREFWADAMDEAGDNAPAIDAFLEKKLKGERPDPKTAKKVSDALLRRGFSWSEVRDGLNRYGAEYFED